jgi:hypothetical protein
MNEMDDLWVAYTLAEEDIEEIEDNKGFWAGATRVRVSPA